MTEVSSQVNDTGSSALEQRFRLAQADFRIGADIQRVRESYPFHPDGTVDDRQWARDYQEAFRRAGLRIDDNPEKVAATIRTSAIRDQLATALDDRAFVAFRMNDGPLVERLLGIARAADPEPHWRDRFRDPAVWRSPAQLQQLAAEAFDVSPPPPAHQLAFLGWLLHRRRGGNRMSRLLGELCRRQPGSFWLNREMGQVLFFEGRYLEAAGYYRSALALRPDNASVHEQLGTALFAAGQTDDALAAYRRAVELAPTSGPCRARLVAGLAAAGYWQDAQAECDRALQINPADRLAPALLGSALSQHQRYQDAVVLYRRLAETDPRDVNAFTCLGRALMRLNRPEDAVQPFRKVTELIPANARAHGYLATALTAAGRPAEAIAELQTAIAIAPAAPWYYLDLGVLLRGQGRPEAAAAVLQKVVALQPQLATAWNDLAAALLDCGRFAEARAATQHLLTLPATEPARRAQRRQIDLCESLLSIHADLPAILAGKGRPVGVSTQIALAKWRLKHSRFRATTAGYYEAALMAQPSLADDLEAGIRFDAACAAAAAGCGIGDDVTELDGRRRAALRRQALDWLTAEYNAWATRHRQGKPGDRTIAATAVRSWLQNEDLAGVRGEQALAGLPPNERQAWQSLWAQVASLAARDPVALLDQARAHVARREWKEATGCYAEALALEPTDEGGLWFEYAAAQLLAGDRPGYRRTCSHMLARGPATPQMRTHLVARACTLASGSAHDPAELDRLCADELERSRNTFWSLTEQGALQVRAGRFQDAVLLLDSSLAADERTGRAVLNWLWLAIAYQKWGKTDEARHWLGKAAGWLDQQEGLMPVDTVEMGVHRHNWLEANVLREEAEALLASSHAAHHR